MEKLKAWLITRVVSSMKCKQEAADAMGSNEASAAAINQFFADEECQRVLVYAAPDLTAVRVCFYFLFFVVLFPLVFLSLPLTPEWASPALHLV